MALANFSIIVAIDAGNGIAKNGEIPWKTTSDGKFFRDITLGRGKNAIIMGRGTYEAIPEENRPLQGRHCVIISRTWKQEEHPEITICESLIDAYYPRRAAAAGPAPRPSAAPLQPPWPESRTSADTRPCRSCDRCG